jgi:hypothetical protein
VTAAFIDDTRRVLIGVHSPTATQQIRNARKQRQHWEIKHMQQDDSAQHVEHRERDQQKEMNRNGGIWEEHPDEKREIRMLPCRNGIGHLWEAPQVQWSVSMRLVGELPSGASFSWPVSLVLSVARPCSLFRSLRFDSVHVRWPTSADALRERTKIMMERSSMGVLDGNLLIDCTSVQFCLLLLDNINVTLMLVHEKL